MFDSRPIIVYYIYIIDFTKASQKFNFIMYADDITLPGTLDSVSTYEQNGNVEFDISTKFNTISEWLKQNKLSIKLNKTKYMPFKTVRRKSVTSPLLLLTLASFRGGVQVTW